MTADAQRAADRRTDRQTGSQTDTQAVELVRTSSTSQTKNTSTAPQLRRSTEMARTRRCPSERRLALDLASDPRGRRRPSEK